MSEFNFDHWRTLAQDDPKAFFAEREREIEQLIGSAPSGLQGKLWDLQHSIDCERVRAGTPSRAMRSLARMMQERLEALDHQNQELQVLSSRLRELTHTQLGILG